MGRHLAFKDEPRSPSHIPKSSIGNRVTKLGLSMKLLTPAGIGLTGGSRKASEVRGYEKASKRAGERSAEAIGFSGSTRRQRFGRFSAWRYEQDGKGLIRNTFGDAWLDLAAHGTFEIQPTGGRHCGARTAAGAAETGPLAGPGQATQRLMLIKDPGEGLVEKPRAKVRQGPWRNASLGWDADKMERYNCTARATSKRNVE